MLAGSNDLRESSVPLAFRLTQPARRWPRVAALGCVASLICVPLGGQTAVPDANGRLIFRANVRRVVIDVVVTGKDGAPLQGLRKEDFLVSEDGHPQPISSFEEHKAADLAPAALPNLPGNVFTNIPRVTPTDSVTVLLMDSLNTQVQDQSFVRAQMNKYLQSVQPGHRMAIFTLGNRLRYVQGFSDDPGVLAAALKDSKRGSGPQSSALLQSTPETTSERESIGQLAAYAAEHPSPGTAAALATWQQFLAEQSAFKTDQRARMTLDALQQLGRYLAGIPGRKNVVWFSGSFPLTLFPDPNLLDSFSISRSYGEEVRKTDDILAAAQVSIYPIAAEGLASDTLYNADRSASAMMTAAPTIGAPAASAGGPQAQNQGQQMQQGEISSLQGDSVQRNGNHATMEQIAKDTGGQAFFNTNGLNDALARVMDDGSHFYTLSYTPDTAADGKFHKLQVKLVRDNSSGTASGGYKLAYRRGYYAAEPKVAQAAAAIGDPLHPFMGPGMPSSTQIPFAMRLRPEGTVTANGPDPTPEIAQRAAPVTDSFGRMQMKSHPDLQTEAAASSRAGDNPKMKGPLQRYAVDMVVATSGLQLDPSPKGGCGGGIEATLVIYDQDGRPLNWIVRQLDLTMDAARYALAKANGVNFTLEIDAPKGSTSVRGGVYDQMSSVVGTLEVPLTAVLNPQTPGLKKR